MERLENLLRSSLKASSGVETTPACAQQTELQRHCMAVIEQLVAGREELLRRVLLTPRTHPHDILVEDKNFDTDVSNHVEAYLSEHLVGVPPSTRAVISRFLPIGIQAQYTIIASFIEDRDYCVTPQELETFRDASVRYCILLSGYPAAIAQTAKIHMDMIGASALDGLDISEEFASRTRLDMLLKLQTNELQRDVINRLDRCPAHEGIDAFANLMFDLFAAAYKEAYDSFTDEKGMIAPCRKRELTIEVRDRWLASGPKRIRKMYDEE